jgi:hypothetical protein
LKFNTLDIPIGHFDCWSLFPASPLGHNHMYNGDYKQTAGKPFLIIRLLKGMESYTPFKKYHHGSKKNKDGLGA